MLLVAAFDLMQRRLRDMDVAALDQLRHLPIKEGQQQGADVRTVHVGVGHDDDSVVTQLVRIELVLSYATAQGGDQRPDLSGRQHFIEPRSLDVENLASQRENRLGAARASLFRGTTRGVTLDEVKF